MIVASATLSIGHKVLRLVPIAAATLREGFMGLFDWFRRPKPPVRDWAELADFIDQHAAFLTQKGIYEYSRARAGHYSKVLFREQGFLDAVEKSRWSAYPLGLAMVAEAAEGMLRPHTPDRRAVVDRLAASVLAIFDRYPVPPQVGEAAWADLRAELARWLDLIGTHAVKHAKDIAVPYAERYIAAMPIYAKLRTAEGPTITNYLRVSMCNIHDELSERMDAAAVAGQVSSPVA
jgi:hypothetical protein